MRIKARVENGFIVADAPPGYEEGEEVDVRIIRIISSPNMTAEEIAELNGLLEVALGRAKAGEAIDYEELFQRVRRKPSPPRGGPGA